MVLCLEQKQRYDSYEWTYVAGLVALDKDLVDAEGAGPRGETQDEGVGGSRVEGLDAVDNIVGDVGAGSLAVVTDDESHVDGCFSFFSLEEGKKDVCV